MKVVGPCRAWEFFGFTESEGSQQRIFGQGKLRGLKPVLWELPW